MTSRFLLGIGAVALLFCVSLNPISPGEGILGSAALTQGNTAQDEALFGDNWQSVRIFRLTTPLSRPLKVYISNKSGYKSQYMNYIIESLEDWRQALDGRFQYMLTQDPNQADITIDWVASFPEPSVAGLTTYRVGHAAIEIKTTDIPEADILANIMHEIGHALGISGHSRSESDIMVGYRKWQRKNSTYHPRLSSRDIQAIRRLYSTAWNQGEDLYAAAAQNAGVQIAKQSAPTNNPQAANTLPTNIGQVSVTNKQPVSGSSPTP